MRMMWWRALQGVGVAAVAVGIIGIAVFGADSRIVTGPHEIDTDASAVVTRPGVIGWKNVQVEILAEVPGDKPVFVGIANSVDVTSYVADTRRLEVTDFTTPWGLETTPGDGNPAVPAAPTALDWWLAGEGGFGGALVDTRLPDETVSAAIVSVGDANLRGLQITLAYGIEGIFARSLGLIAAGAAVVVLVQLAAGRRRGPEESVVYVLVDDDGVERELTADELAALGEVEIVDDEERDR